MKKEKKFKIEFLACVSNHVGQDRCRIESAPVKEQHLVAAIEFVDAVVVIVVVVVAASQAVFDGRTFLLDVLGQQQQADELKPNKSFVEIAPCGVNTRLLAFVQDH